MNNYKDYGGRGITVCDRWMKFENFLADMGERPTGTELDRINNDGNYEPGNCRWVAAAQNSRNRRSTRMITFNGETLCLNDWAKRLGVDARTIVWRLDHGVDVETALTSKRLRR